MPPELAQFNSFEIGLNYTENEKLEEISQIRKVFKPSLNNLYSVELQP